MLKTTFKGFVDSLGQFQDMPNRISRHIQMAAMNSMRSSAQILLKHTQDSIRAENAVASGEMLNSLEVTGFTSTTNEFSIAVNSPVKWSSYIENGTDAGGGMPPVDKIYEWMSMKGMEPSIIGAYFIAKAVQRRGLPDTRKPFAKAAQNAESAILANIRNRMVKELTFGKNRR